MPKQEGQKSKLLTLLRILEQKTDEEHLLNVPQLVELLEQQDILAERKSIYSDIDTLRSLGYDIQLRRGRGGGYWLASRTFELSELKLLVDAVQAQVLYYGDTPAGTSYFAMSNGRTEASENVWGTALPYLVPVDSSTDTAADNYEYTLNLSAAQLQQLLSERLGIAADLSQQAQWFGTPVLTPSGYVDSLPVCGQTVQGTALRKALGLRSACFTVVCQSGTFSFTTRGYGHSVGMSQWGAKALAEQGADYRAILAHYYPGTELRE